MGHLKFDVEYWKYFRILLQTGEKILAAQFLGGVLTPNEYDTQHSNFMWENIFLFPHSIRSLKNDNFCVQSFYVAQTEPLKRATLNEALKCKHYS